MAESPGTDPSDEVLPDGVSSEGVRLQKVLAQAGIASRRAAEAMIVEGRVRVDNVVVTELGTRVDPATAVVHVKKERDALRARPRRRRSPSAHLGLLPPTQRQRLPRPPSPPRSPAR